MKRPTRFSHLSPAWKKLVRQMQRLNFGSISGIQFVDGEPVLDANVKIMARYRFRADNEVRPERSLPDFPLPEEVLWLHQTLHAEGCCRIARLEVRGGLPKEVDLEI